MKLQSFIFGHIIDGNTDEINYRAVLKIIKRNHPHTPVNNKILALIYLFL
jgi:hypothetical protein